MTIIRLGGVIAISLALASCEGGRPTADRVPSWSLERDVQNLERTLPADQEAYVLWQIRMAARTAEYQTFQNVVERVSPFSQALVYYEANSSAGYVLFVLAAINGSGECVLYLVSQNAMREERCSSLPQIPSGGRQDAVFVRDATVAVVVPLDPTANTPLVRLLVEEPRGVSGALEFADKLERVFR